MRSTFSALALAATMAGVVTTLGCARAGAQELPPGYIDPAPILRAAAEAIGTANLRCVSVSGVAEGSIVGQQRLNGYQVDWPDGEPLLNYTRTMDWEAGTMVEEFDREPGHNPAGWKHGLGWRGGTPI
jgi:predicted amidohydrolase